MKTITLYDVASQAGVSYQTVSRVINDAAHVSVRTREKVLAAMAALHYVPNRGAQQLAGKRSRTLGLLTTDLALHAPSQIASAVKSRAGLASASVIISMLEQHDAASCSAALQELLAQRVEGVLINVPLEDAQAEQLAAQAQPTPLLFLDVSDKAAVNSLVFDAEQGARLSVEHVLSQGHQRIALLGGPQSSVSARARFSGWLAALAQAKLNPCASEYGDWSAASGYEKAHLLLAHPRPPQAILVANDQMALGVMRACAEKGIDVPGQISVVGYDDTADSAWFSPPLTTVRQAFKDAGERSVDWLLNPPDRELALSQIRLPVTLIERLSTAPAHERKIRCGEALARQLNELAQQVAMLDRR
ncbi:DNA-binding transcriptional regulator, LacI/PurR family [Kosakonia arachidis]|uniref:DNA-binding transcriptional regulator, LacI/PurR family n=1 Tax=Kosakonia arachidis TaxID=551989 RepID=A0A1I6XX23_9ENTR|nr:LacI family DNA-binding transcriptional regulator [Kosakonia arachidis]SFT42314.1 DNA-binding transcriptional regulator, LacI/PurR family [Kosakonia arachidis]